MCGIAGLFDFESPNGITVEDILPMISALRHRGPDDQRGVAFPDGAFGSSRLSIVDLEGGYQPFVSEDGVLTLVGNGEIYNAPELRSFCESRGHRFRSESDLEVIVHLFEEEGEACWQRLNGMFAIALYDSRHRRLWLVRDRFGVKPLFFSLSQQRIAFASEIKALKVAGVPLTLDEEALAVYLGLFFIPDPWTIYRDIRTLPPGQVLSLSPEGSRQFSYADFDFSRPRAIGAAAAEEELIHLFQQAVKRQMMADVPVGVLLSGGLDSRSVLWVASRYQARTPSFTITFDQKEYSEQPLAAAWARYCGSPHFVLNVNDDMFCRYWLNRQRHLDEPYGIWCNVALEAMADLIHRQGLKVVLSGEGGDELFCGYPTLNAAYFSRWLQRLVPSGGCRTIARWAERLPAGKDRLPLSFQIKSFFSAQCEDIVRTFYRFKAVVPRSLWPNLLTPSAQKSLAPYDPFAAYEQHRHRTEGWSLADALSYLDLKVFLAGNLLPAADNAFMARSVELRVPFLDNDLAAWACRVPASLRFHLWGTKRLPRRALRRFLTRDAQGKAWREPRYRKLGFEVPAAYWMEGGPFADQLTSVLDRRRLERTGFFQPDAVQSLMREQREGRRNHERKLQAISSLVLFLDGVRDLEPTVSV